MENPDENPRSPLALDNGYLSIGGGLMVWPFGAAGLWAASAHKNKTRWTYEAAIADAEKVTVVPRQQEELVSMVAAYNARLARGQCENRRDLAAAASEEGSPERLGLERRGPE